jgi:hypothetical protein
VVRRFIVGESGHPTGLERWLLGGQDPDAPVTRLAMLRMRGIVALSLALAILGIGLMLYSFQRDYRANDATLADACEGRNVQSRQSKVLLERFAVAEQEENEELADDYAALAAQARDPERRRFLLALGRLELKRDRATAALFRELANNVRIQDCQGDGQR